MVTSQSPISIVFARYGVTSLYRTYFGDRLAASRWLDFDILVTGSRRATGWILIFYYEIYIVLGLANPKVVGRYTL
jgi:hypothetical protein